MIQKRRFAFGILLVVLALSTLACGLFSPPAPQVPPPVAGANTANQQHYSVQELYTEAQQIAETNVESRMHSRAWLWFFALAIFVFAGGVFLGLDSAGLWSVALIVAILLGSFGAFVNNAQIPGKVDEVGHQLADQAITQGVDLAQRAQATNYQYIHAVVSQIGMEIQNCERTVNHRDFCSSETPYYTNRDINSHQVCTTSTDADGKTTESCHEEHDEEYTPWFTHVVRYYIIPDTRAKYLSEQIYHQLCLADSGAFEPCAKDEYGVISDKRKPVVYANTDWRAPKDAMNHLYCETGIFGTSCERPGSYNEHVPDAYTMVKNAKENGGPVVDATFIGPYFNWGFAADSPLYDVYDGDYNTLKSLVNLPGPSGVTYTITDSYGKPATLPTSLVATDGDLAIGFNPVTVIGSCVNPDQIQGYAEYAMQVQGDFGPTKQGSLRWFLVCDSVVQQLGGMPYTVSAVKAYLRDAGVWSLFSMPKNLVFAIASISDDGTRITGRGLETGMPAGNTLVIQRVNASIPAGESLPLTKENLFGTFTANYNPSQGDKFTYQFSDLTQAGSVIGLLYEKDPNYTPPDPSDPSCTGAKADHIGFVRYSTCNTDYLKTTIEVNEDGRFLIMNTVTQGAIASTPVFGAWMVLLLAIGALFFAAYARSNM